MCADHCLNKVGAIHAAALAHARNRSTATDEKKKSLLHFFVVISPVGTISGKPLKLLPQDVIFKDKMHKIRFRLRLRSRPCWGSLQRSPDTFAGFKGTYF